MVQLQQFCLGQGNSGGLPHLVRHQNIAAEKSQPSPRSLQYGQEQIEFRFVESFEFRTQVNRDEEDAVRVA